MAESLALAAMAVSGGFAKHAMAMTSSHFASAERQYRFPLVYGGQRTPTAQWTVTGAGCALLGEDGDGPYVTSATIGKIVDWGIKDANNMGAAMAPAAYQTIVQHLKDRGLQPQDYDLIVTGDLGSVGKHIVLDFFNRDGISMENVYDDCGVMVFDCKKTGCPRRRLRLRLQRQRFLRLSVSADEAEKISEAASVRYRRAAVHHFHAAGGIHPLHLPCRINRTGKELKRMEYLKAFLTGGILCAIGQILIDKTKLTPARILVSYVVAGVILGGLGIYQYLVDWGGAGATIPLTGFGYNLAKGVKEAVQEQGLLGVLIGGVKASAAGITAAIFFGYLAALLFRPKDKS